MEGKGGLSGACALTKGQALAGQRLAILTGTQRGEGQHCTHCTDEETEVVGSFTACLTLSCLGNTAAGWDPSLRASSWKDRTTLPRFAPPLAPLASMHDLAH